MSKEKERQMAHFCYVEMGKNAKETAAQVGVAEKTVGEWVSKYNWKKERAARLTAPKKSRTNVEMIILNKSEEILKLYRELESTDPGDFEKIDALRTQIRQVDDGVSKWNKSLQTMEKENRVSPFTYLYIMEEIFNAMRIYNMQLFNSTVEFQDYHVRKIISSI